MPRRLRIVARVATPAGARDITVTGQTARSLVALVEAGPKGRTALEVSTWALRFAAYCHDLTRKHGLTIVCHREDHPGGWHGRHELRDRVTILATEGG